MMDVIDGHGFQDKFVRKAECGLQKGTSNEWNTIWTGLDGAL